MCKFLSLVNVSKHISKVTTFTITVSLYNITALLGPNFCTDIVVVETADHARLSLQLSYSW